MLICNEHRRCNRNRNRNRIELICQVKHVLHSQKTNGHAPTLTLIEFPCCPNGLLPFSLNAILHKHYQMLYDAHAVQLIQKPLQTNSMNLNDISIEKTISTYRFAIANLVACKWGHFSFYKMQHFSWTWHNISRNECSHFTLIESLLITIAKYTFAIFMRRYFGICSPKISRSKI